MLVLAFLACASAAEPFYKKNAETDGIPIRASAAVAEAALAEARVRLHRMLARIPAVAKNLSDAGAELHVIGKDQSTTDLPEHRDMKGKPFDGELTMDERTRGVGGLLASCGEENLLHLKSDRYRDGRDICVHEFAHTLRNFGLTPEARKRFDRRYHSSLARGLWETAYAGTNPDEYFAELSMWYFGSRGDYGAIKPEPRVGAAWLKAYDPEGYALLDELYSGRMKVAAMPWSALEPLPADKEGVIRSGDGPEADVRFDNLTEDPVELFWLDGDGRRKGYGVIAPATKREQHTYVSHAWLLVRRGKPFAIYVAGRERGFAAIKD